MYTYAPLRLFLLSYFVASFLSMPTFAQGEIKLISEDNQEFLLPLDFMKVIPVILNQAIDMGIYDINKNIINQSDFMLIMVHSSFLESIVNVLVKAKNLLLAQGDLFPDQINPSKLEESAEEVYLARVTQDRPLDKLLDEIQAANYLEVKPLVNAAVKVFAKISSKPEKSNFHNIILDLKKLIISKQKPQQFMALMNANQEAQSYLVEEAFAEALHTHFRDKKLSAEASAEENYKKRYFAVFANYLDFEKFSIMDAPITQEEYAWVMGENPSLLKSAHNCPASFREIEVDSKKIAVCADFPVEDVKYDDALRFAARMRELDLSHCYSLPTEADVEVAFHASTKAYVWGEDIKKPGSHVWFDASALGSKFSNNLRINRTIWEWTKGWCSEENKSLGSLDGEVPKLGLCPVFRAGNVRSNASISHIVPRGDLKPRYSDSSLGFRLIRSSL